MTVPMIYRWTGEAMEPTARFRAAADDDFTVGELYRLDPCEVRSEASHRHYFATLQDIWLSLPEEVHFASVEHLRKFALIRTGYRDERSIACASRAEAQRVAAFIRPMDDFAVVLVTEAMVTVYTAKSQSRKAMGHKVFQESKDAVLDYCHGLLDPSTLGKQTEVA